MITLIGAILGLILGMSYVKSNPDTNKIAAYGGGALLGALLFKITSGLINLIIFIIFIALIISFFKKSKK